MKLLGSNKNKTTKNENGEYVPHLEIIEVVLDHCNFVNNDYQYDWILFYIVVFNKWFGQLLDLSPKKLYF